MIDKQLFFTRYCFLAFCFFVLISHPLFSQEILPHGGNKPSLVKIAGVGDIMMGSAYPSERFLPPGDNPLLLLREVVDSLVRPDITFGNLEGSFLDFGDPVKRCRDSNLCYLFRMPERYAGVLKSAGFDFLSLANNHFGDFGWNGARKTYQLLDQHEIKYSGPVEVENPIIVKDSVRYGFIAFSTTAGANNLNDIESSAALVKNISGKCDILIVSFHGGAEGADYQRVAKTSEFFHGEDRGDLVKFAHRMIDCGADIIFGHGPHVTRAIELYNDRLICYSLGNFFTYGRFNINGPNGLAPIINVSVDTSGRFMGGSIIPVFQEYSGMVRIDQQKRVISKIKDLTRLDFPDTGLIIKDDGTIQKK